MQAAANNKATTHKASDAFTIMQLKRQLAAHRKDRDEARNERDEARNERDEAIAERDEAIAELNPVKLERNRARRRVAALEKEHERALNSQMRKGI